MLVPSLIKIAQLWQNTDFLNWNLNACIFYENDIMHANLFFALLTIKTGPPCICLKIALFQYNNNLSRFVIFIQLKIQSQSTLVK